MGLPLFRAINHTIPLIDKDKIYPWYPARCPEALREQWDMKWQTYLKAGHWEANTLPMLLIPKVKMNPLGLHLRNTNMKKMTSPLPDMEGILRRISQCKYHSLIDGQDAYKQVSVVLEHVGKTAMSTLDGNMVSFVLQQRHCNTLATYQSLMNCKGNHGSPRYSGTGGGDPKVNWQ
ncbi:hypothetical protein B0H19DRAFT_1020353 [Mycena capillaripes]|nr:hypothetical protein B0H19DRAFT_1020353 [Mycena capillaripes]